MKKIIFPVFLLLAACSIFSIQESCKFDNEEDRFGGIACDTVAVKYSAKVKSLVQTHCISCHSPGGQQESQPFTTYNDLSIYAENGTLTDRINNATSPMPPTGLLDECDRAMIDAWIKAGYPNN
jgi:mono/diheme cytochrome c family protein